MLDLTGKDTYKKLVVDSATGNEILLEHRLPTTEEEIDFQRRTFQRRGKKKISPEDIVKNLTEVRIDFGMRILTGFREGDLGRDGKPISADVNSPGYDAGWKELLREKAPRIIAGLATAVFEGGRVVAAEEEDESPFLTS